MRERSIAADASQPDLEVLVGHQSILKTVDEGIEQARFKGLHVRCRR